MRSLDDAARKQIVDFMRKCSAQLANEKAFAVAQAEEMRLDLFAFINTFDDQETYEFLKQLLQQQDDAALTNQAFDAFIQMPNREPVHFLEEVLQHSDAGWRWAGCRALGNLDSCSSSKPRVLGVANNQFSSWTANSRLQF